MSPVDITNKRCLHWHLIRSLSYLPAIVMVGVLIVWFIVFVEITSLSLTIIISIGISILVAVLLAGVITYTRKNEGEKELYLYKKLLPPALRIPSDLPLLHLIPRTFNIEQELCLYYIRKELKLSDKAEIVVEPDFSSNQLSHRFDLAVRDNGILYVIEIKDRAILPSDITNLSKLHSSLIVEVSSIRLIVCTPYKPSTLVKKLAELNGLRIIIYGWSSAMDRKELLNRL